MPFTFVGLQHLASTSGDAAEEEAFFKENAIYNKDVLEGLEELYQQYVLSRDPNKLARIRIENIKAFHAFVILCMRNTLGVMAWKMKHRRMPLTDIFSVSDEALALVILENNAMVWRNKAFGEAETNAKYMQIAKDGSVRKVWSDEGMKRFNNLFQQVKELRSFSLSRTNEMELMKIWSSKKSKNGSGTRDQLAERDGEGGGVNSSRREIIVICEG